MYPVYLVSGETGVFYDIHLAKKTLIRVPTPPITSLPLLEPILQNRVAPALRGLLSGRAI